MEDKLESCCELLESNKVTSRRKGYDDFNEIIHDRATLNYFAEHGPWWNKILNTLQIALIKDAEKRYDEIKKKGPQSNYCAPKSGDIFFNFVRVAVKDAAPFLNTRRLFTFILESLNKETFRNCFEQIFLKALSQCILANPLTRSKLQSKHWEELLHYLKSHINIKNLDHEQIKCLTATLKWGFVCNLPVSTFREEFSFIEKICLTVSSVTPIVQQEAIVELIQEFCKLAAKDNRMSCCKLGEAVFNNFIQLYETNPKIKSQLLDFFLLQVAIHHPNGADKDSPAAYAFDWSQWQNHLKLIYCVLNNDIEQSADSLQRNQWFFVADGQVKNLLENFVTLFVESYKQITCNDNFDLGTFSPESDSECPIKRQKIDGGLRILFLKIKNTKYWPWINLTHSLITTYPEIIEFSDYSTLLKTLTILQSEEKDTNLRYHVFKTLIVTEKLESRFNLKQESWTKITETTLRSIDSEDNEEQVQQLLQLVVNNDHVKAENFVQSLKVLKLSEYSLDTIEIAFKKFVHLQCDIEFKNRIIDWLLLSNNKQLYCNKNLARVLASMVLKQWPENGDFPDLVRSARPYGDVEEIYLETACQRLLIKNKNFHESVAVITSHCPDLSVLEYLIKSLKAASKNCDFTHIRVGEFLSLSVLLINVTSFLLNYEVIGENNLDDFPVYKLSMLVIDILFKNLDFKIKYEERDLKKLIKIVKSFKLLFSNNITDVLALKLRNIIPTEVIRWMFEILADDKIDKVQGALTLKCHVIETIVNFSCLPLNGNKSKDQKNALGALMSYDYDSSSDLVFECVVFLFSALKSVLKEVSADDVLNLLNILQGACEHQYHSYSSTLQLLQMFSDIAPIMFNSKFDELKKDFVGILETFYKRRLDYGPAVSVALVNCIGLLFQLDPESRFCRWSDEEIVSKLPEFLASDHQEVRFAAVKNLTRIFKTSSISTSLNHFHQQEIMFSRIQEHCLKVFEIEGNVNEERRIDETVTRTSSVLHTFAAIMVSANVWIEDALFALLKIITDKFLGLNSTKEIISLIALELNFKSRDSFLEKYLVSVFNRWINFSIENFPFGLYSCNTKDEFYAKFFNILSPIIVEVEAKPEIVGVIAKIKGKTIEELMEESLPRLLSFCIGKSRDDIASNEIYNLLMKCLGKERVREIALDKIAEIILNLCEYIIDPSDFQMNFHINIVFGTSDDFVLTVAEFQECLEFIESSLYNGDNIMLHLLRNEPEKIPHLLLNLKRSIVESKAVEERLKKFHVFSVISFLFVKSVSEEAKMQRFIIRDVIYTLLHFIKCPDLSEVSCRFLQKCLVKFLEDLTRPFKEFFFTIVSRLKIVSLEDNKLSPICLEMLEFLLVDHTNVFLKEIEQLDTFPEIPGFRKISDVHRKIKDSRQVHLREEITQFLDFSKTVGNFDECQHGLKQLTILLSSRKEELKSILEDLRSRRRFSEDCEKSVLHQLICTLTKMSSSTNKNVRNEALRCLGEIGPSNLSTLVLQPENPIPDSKWSPWELVCGHVISLLVNYIIDPDINVTATASEILFKILETREGKKVTVSGEDFGYGKIKSEFLTPFHSKICRKTSFNVTLDFDLFVEKISARELWISPDNSHKSWITNLVCSILEAFNDRPFFDSFIRLSKIKTDFCEHLLPLLIFLLQTLKVNDLQEVLSEKISEFFSEHWQITVGDSNATNVSINKSSVQCMLNTVSFTRLQCSVRTKKQIRELELDYLNIAKAAQFCTAHFTALLYTELWCQQQVDLDPLHFNESHGCTKLDLIYEKIDSVKGNALQNILRSCYKAVGESDALFGCGTSHLLNPSYRVDDYKELGRWDQVINRYQIDISLKKDTVKPQDLIDSFKNSNLIYFSSLFSKLNNEPDYESFWRLSQWDFNDTNQNNLNQQNVEKFKFNSLKAIHQSDDFALKNNLELFKNCVVENLNDVNLEGCKNFYSILTQLQAFKEIEDFSDSLTSNNIIDLVNKWSYQDEIVQNDFQYLEPINAQRIVLLTNHLKKTRVDNNLKQVVVDLMLDFAEYSRIEGHSNITSRTLATVREIPDLSSDIFAKIQLEEANLCWSIQDPKSAKCILRHLSNSSDINPRLHAAALKLTGKWLVEEASENRQTIIDNYFLKSLELIKRLDRSEEDERSLIETYDQLAKFADRAYQQVMSHIKSDSFQKKKENMEKSALSLEQMNASASTQRKPSRELLKAIQIKKKFILIDKNEISAIEAEKDSLLKLALNYYLKNLLRSDLCNINVFRVISLLLENRSNAVIQSVLENHLLKIPTYKFIDILPQIIPHIFSPTSDLLTQTINVLIKKCAEDHPHHTLPLILALAFSEKESKEAVQDDRTKCAKAILNKLKKKPELASLIKKMEFVSEALIEIAYVESNKSKEDMPSKSLIKKISGYDDVLVPTVQLPVNKNCIYDKIIGISYWENSYVNVGGINCPKRVVCRGSDGLKRAQLVKGQDDLRQDAVMQQVFTIINSLLAVNKNTRDLLVRTYKVVPLSMRSGILEWVTNSMPISEYLTGSNDEVGAHEKYRPSDRTPKKCRADFSKVAQREYDAKLRVFKDICKHIQPVLHTFFESTFPQPTVWYERRRAYTRSVATTSMCGYILGIGDRHVNNILIDKSTAEVIHIDFGIAFEQGRCLPTPETVPFRLTRDIVDGFGVSGVEGVFRKSCEKTMELLRSHQQTIITILEVLLYDPLYDWTVSTAEANKRQYDGDDTDLPNITECSDSNLNTVDVNVTAERALLRLRAKLQGTESGQSTTVEHQVGTLIQQAMDPANLCRLFNGWQPYL